MLLNQRLAMPMGFVKSEPLQALADILGQPGLTPGSIALQQAAGAMCTFVSGQMRGKLALRVAA
jgi:hypothetical protein